MLKPKETRIRTDMTVPDIKTETGPPKIAARASGTFRKSISVESGKRMPKPMRIIPRRPVAIPKVIL